MTAPPPEFYGTVAAVNPLLLLAVLVDDQFLNPRARVGSWETLLLTALAEVGEIAALVGVAGHGGRVVALLTAVGIAVLITAVSYGVCLRITGDGAPTPTPSEEAAATAPAAPILATQLLTGLVVGLPVVTALAYGIYLFS